jgi:hypothetical protein
MECRTNMFPIIQAKSPEGGETIDEAPLLLRHFH